MAGRLTSKGRSDPQENLGISRGYMPFSCFGQIVISVNVAIAVEPEGDTVL